jgi:hypothetical protein
MRVTALITCGLFAGAGLAGTLPRGEIAAGWYLNTGDHGDYVAQLDHAESFTGATGARLEAHGKAPVSFGGLSQVSSAAPFRGKRVRFSAGLMTEAVADWAGLWMRADDASGRMVAFDNMQRPDRQLKGTHAWENYSVVLDIPESAVVIQYGVILQGRGKTWIDGVRVESVGPNIPVTSKVALRSVFNPAADPARLPAPRNLDFEE